MFEFKPLCLSSLFIPINYSGNKWEWQYKSINIYNNGDDN